MGIQRNLDYDLLPLLTKRPRAVHPTAATGRRPSSRHYERDALRVSKEAVKDLDHLTAGWGLLQQEAA